VEKTADNDVNVLSFELPHRMAHRFRVQGFEDLTVGIEAFAHLDASAP